MKHAWNEATWRQRRVASEADRAVRMLVEELANESFHNDPQRFHLAACAKNRIEEALATAASERERLGYLYGHAERGFQDSEQDLDKIVAPEGRDALESKNNPTERTP